MVNVKGSCLSELQLRQLLAYPHGNQAEVERRWGELQQHQLASAYSAGSCSVAAGASILGLGYGGLVLLVRRGTQKMALKVRRTDSAQPSLGREALALATANRIGIGPRLVSHSDNFLLMEHLAGPIYYGWLRSAPALPSLKASLHELLDQAYRLDRLGLDHGELRCISNHVVVTHQGPVILDFGSASQRRRPANLTQLVQGLWIGTRLAELLRVRFSHVERSELIEHLRIYKQQPGSATFEALLAYLDL